MTTPHTITTRVPAATDSMTPARERKIRDALRNAGLFHLAPHLFPAACGITEQQARDLWADPAYRGKFLAMADGDLTTRAAG